MWIIAGLFAMWLLWDELLGWLVHAIILALEWLELTVDVLYEELLSLTPEASQLATAWTGLAALIALITWSGFKLRKFYLRYREQGMAWKQAKKDEFRTWWGMQPWFKKLGYAASLCAFLALMVLTS